MLSQQDCNRFWNKVEKDGPGGCWIWSSATNTFGYGKFELDYKMVSAHRIAYELAKGPIPKGKYICHTCDNRRCVNPEHLYPGTAFQNAQDRINRGHQSNGSKRRLTKTQVVELRLLASAGVPFENLCKRFDRELKTISCIVNGHSYPGF